MKKVYAVVEIGCQVTSRLNEGDGDDYGTEEVICKTLVFSTEKKAQVAANKFNKVDRDEGIISADEDARFEVREITVQ